MAKPERERNMTDVRMRKTQVDTLNASFVEIMGSVQKAQGEYRSQFRARIERQYKIAKPDATEAEIEAALDQKRPIFAEQILSGAGQAQRAEAMQLLESIRERHEHIIKLEESIKELRQMFNDMAILVQQQGEVLNDIEKSVESAVNYTDKGLSDMKVSLKLQKKTRKVRRITRLNETCTNEYLIENVHPFLLHRHSARHHFGANTGLCFEIALVFGVFLMLLFICQVNLPQLIPKGNGAWDYKVHDE